MTHGPTKEDDRINRAKIYAYQRLVSALSYERITIKEHGPFSFQAQEADKNTAQARRNYDLWQKK